MPTSLFKNLNLKGNKNNAFLNYSKQLDHKQSYLKAAQKNYLQIEIVLKQIEVKILLVEELAISLNNQLEKNENHKTIKEMRKQKKQYDCFITESSQRLDILRDQFQQFKKKIEQLEEEIFNLKEKRSLS